MTPSLRTLGYRPRNDWIVRELDTRWRRWLWWCSLGAATAGLALAALVGPRQSTIRARYQVAQLTREIEQLEGDHRRLLLEREVLTSPPRMAAELAALGLEPVPRERVLHLAATGLVAPCKPTPAAPRPRAATAGVR